VGGAGPYHSGPMIKYLGSKRRLVPVLSELFKRSDAKSALDLFTGTTRVAQAFKRLGARVTALDSTRCAATLARCYVATDSDGFDHRSLSEVLDDLNAIEGRSGYFTETFCLKSRFFRPENGRRIDAIRSAIESQFKGSPLEPVLLTSLIEAADRVDSTTGVQMAYVKQWADRSFRPLEMRVPALLAGRGTALRGDACDLVGGLGEFDFAYLDPPYNQHRYDSNYHIWETLVAWDAPEHYGIACKRVDLRDGTRSVFNSRATMPEALAQTVRDVRARVLVLSYNDESFCDLGSLMEICGVRGHVEVLEFESNRYVGARIGIHDPRGRRVGTVGRLRNTEYLLVSGDRADVSRIVEPWRAAPSKPFSASASSGVSAPAADRQAGAGSFAPSPTHPPLTCYPLTH
jgi:adenine-specific DNA-methyltransferase